MKLTKALVGKQVRVRWRDQRSMKVVSGHPDRHDIARGRKTLATWEEWGVVDSVEEGVLHLLQGVASDPPHETDRQDELTYSVIPEESIESLPVLEDRPETPT